MDLACPHCDARYRVPDDSVPPDGRTIQCARCGDSWRQSRVVEAIADPEPLAAGIPDFGIDTSGLAMSTVAFGPGHDAERYTPVRSGRGALWPLLIVLAAAGGAFGWGLYTGQIALP